MFYTIYRTINKINGKIYVGMHKTTDLNDDYMGSGKILGYAIEKYGKENFEKEILYTFDNVAEMEEMEAKIVNEAFIVREDTYNIKLGGEGGWTYINSNSNIRAGFETWNTELLSEFSKISGKKGTKNFIEKLGSYELFVEHMNKIGNQGRLTIKQNYPNGIWYGKTHTEETKAKIGAANSKHQSGKGNSQYGMIWIYSEKEKTSKKIYKWTPIPEGWKKGRKIKW